MTVDYPKTDKLNASSSENHLFLFLLAYRWGSLLLAMWLFLATKDVIVPGVSLAFLLALSLGGTLLITIFHAPLRTMLLESPTLIALDLLFVSILLTVSGGPGSPYNLYALSPLLASAFFFHLRGTLLAIGAFFIIYPLTLFAAQSSLFLDIDLGQLFTQLIGACLVTILFGSLSDLLNRLQQTHKALESSHLELARQNQELTATHRQLEVIHELTLFLHAPDRQSVQQQLLKAVTKELGFSQAIVGLVNSPLQRLEQWQIHPAAPEFSSIFEPIPLMQEAGLIAQVALDQQVRWSSDEQILANHAPLNLWLQQDKWLLLPMTWQEQPLGVLLVAAERPKPDEQYDDRWAILTSLVSQAAVALGTLDRTRHLAIEQERNRIARDMHDTVAQSLFGIVFTLDACAKLLPHQVEVVQQELIELRSVADKMRQDVRQSILNIWPSELTTTRFQADLSKHVTNCAPAHIFGVDFTINGDFDGLPAVIRRSLYRVCQEALANAARHAGVDMARIYLYVEPDEVHLSIRDKGRGFNPKKALAREYNREKFGLRGMCERVETLGGTCDILSQSNQGTQILVRVPINGQQGKNGRNGHGP
jgi:signal transduction histidine kinase